MLVSGRVASIVFRVLFLLVRFRAGSSPRFPEAGPDLKLTLKRLDHFN